jgi:hypothetical protein
MSPTSSRSTSAPSPAKANSRTWALVLALLAGCASSDGRGLVAGQSSERDVLAVMGAPAEKDAVGTDMVYWYPQFPWGHASYAARIGADGRLVAFEQRLTEDNIAKIVRGQSTANEVHELLGPAWRPEHYERLQRDIWTYPMRVAGRPLPQWFLVQLSRDGIVRETYLMDDPQFVPQDRGHHR